MLPASAPFVSVTARVLKILAFPHIFLQYLEPRIVKTALDKTALGKE
jgi:hypothetical protein